MKEELSELKGKINKLSRLCQSNSARLDNLEEKKVRKFLQESKEDIQTIHKAYRTLIHKQCVASEVLWAVQKRAPESAPFLSTTVIKSFEMNDDWWVSREDYTLKQWIDTFLDLAEEMLEA